MRLMPCVHCARHVRVDASVCPFCREVRAPERSPRGAWLLCATAFFGACAPAEAQPRPARRRARDAATFDVSADASTDASSGDSRAATTAAPRVDVEVGECRVERDGGASYEMDLHAWLVAHSGTLVECYEPVRRAHPTIEGTIEARMTFDAAGRVTSAEAGGMPGFPEVAVCVATSLRAMTLPSRRGGGAVNVPLRFSPTIGESARVPPVRRPLPFPARNPGSPEHRLRLEVVLYGAPLKPREPTDPVREIEFLDDDEESGAR